MEHGSTNNWKTQMRQKRIIIGLALAAAVIRTATGADILDVKFTVPMQTRGEGDQFPWTQLAGGDHITVVNDGRGPHNSIGNHADRRTSSIVASVGLKYNHKPWLVKNLNVSDINNPQWTTCEIGYQDVGPPEKVDGINVGAFYSFSVLAIGNNTIIVPIALAGDRHSSADYRGTEVSGRRYHWGGSAFIITTNRGSTWRLRNGTRLGAFDWVSSPLPTSACTFIPRHVSGLGGKSPFTMLMLMQMGAGYTDNTDGYVYAFAPNGHINEHLSNDTTQRQTVLARCFIGKDHSHPTVVWDPANWTVWDGSGWSADFSTRRPVITWPEKGTNHGQAWYPSVICLPSQGVYLAVASTLQPPGYPNPASKMYVYAAVAPQGPWTQVYASKNITLQGDPHDRIFSPNWIPGWCDLNAGKDSAGNDLVGCYLSCAGLGDVDTAGWTREEKKRYGINIGKFLFTFADHGR
jgi:hypothetical protein